MLSAKTRKTIEYINNCDNRDGVALNTDSFLGEVIDIAALLRREDIYISLVNSSGDIIYIAPGRVTLQTTALLNGFGNGVYTTLYPTVLVTGDRDTPHVTDLSMMIKMFNERHFHKVSLSKILKDNIENTYNSLYK